MSRTLVLFSDAHGIARGKVVNETFRPGLEIGCASGVFSKDIFGTPQLFNTLATPFGAADIRIHAEDGQALGFEQTPGFLFGVSSIAVGTVSDPRDRPHPLDFRRMLRDHIKQFPDLNRYAIGAELEFYLQTPDDVFLKPDGQAYAFSGASALQICLDAMMESMDRVGIQWTSFSQENSSNQYEFSLHHSSPLEQADRIFLARFLLRFTAARHGLRCTFVPVVSKQASPSNLHLHISDAKSEGLDKLCSGIASALLGPFLAMCPTRNARLVEGIESFSSKKFNVGHGDRFKALRLVRSHDHDHVELRTPTSDANPYLAILMILGGLQFGAVNIGGELLLSTQYELEWDFEASIEAFVADTIVRKILTDDTVNLFSSMKRLEGKKSSTLDFHEEVSLLKTVI